MEVTILILFIILFIIITIYIVYFYYEKLKKIKELKKDGSFVKENYKETHKPNKAITITTYVILSLFFVFSLTFGTFAIIHKAKGDIFEINNNYIVSINSESMSYVNENNETINGEDATRLYKYDIVSFTKINDQNELKQYQIILFRSYIDNKEILIAHRIIRIDNGLYYTRGDANPQADSSPVQYENILGIYKETLTFPSLINSMVRSYNFIVLLTFVAIDLIIVTIFKGITNKEINSQ